jgi:hypothetical protein
VKLQSVIEIMEESTTFQAIIRKGMARARRQDLLAVGKKRFGVAAPPNVVAFVEATTDPEELQRFLLRALEVRSWEGLFGLPKPSPRRRKKSERVFA